jgi:hypothetical protein
MKQKPNKSMKIALFLLAFLFLSGCAVNRTLVKQSLLMEQIEEAVDLASLSSLRGLPTSEKLFFYKGNRAYKFTASLCFGSGIKN